MRILVGKTFGIGNSVLTIPMIKALATLGTVDVLVGSGPDDFGALSVMSKVKCINKVHVDHAIDPSGKIYDVAVMAIPFDGRWQDGRHYQAKVTLDSRKRPDNVDRLGFDMWKKHEVEYQMENARLLGYSGETPSTEFLQAVLDPQSTTVYVGLGYKRDAGGFGLSKHWGNDRYVEFIQRLSAIRHDVNFISTGGLQDLFQCGYPIIKSLGDTRRFNFKTETLDRTFQTMAECCAYVGNDTGAMHIAASMGLPTYALMAYSDLTVKNHPFKTRNRCMVFARDGITTWPPVEYVANDFAEFAWGLRSSRTLSG